MDGKTTIYEKGQMIYQQGDKPNSMYLLKKGRVRSFILSPNGSEKTIAVFEDGNLFGKSAFFDKQPYFSGAKALSRSEIVVIDKTMMSKIISNNPQFAIDMLADLSKTIRMLSNQIESMSFHQADKRVARFLLDNISNSPYVNCTHDEISATIGTSRVTVSKILSRFEKSGFIETNYRMIKITNKQTLLAFADN